jgi:hypothetical protein
MLGGLLLASIVTLIDDRDNVELSAGYFHMATLSLPILKCLVWVAAISAQQKAMVMRKISLSMSSAAPLLTSCVAF